MGRNAPLDAANAAWENRLGKSLLSELRKQRVVEIASFAENRPHNNNWKTQYMSTGKFLIKSF
jgi:hypothetical protein